MKNRVDNASKIPHFQLPTKLPAFVNKAALAVTGLVYSTLRSAVSPLSVKQVKDKEKSKARSTDESYPLEDKASLASSLSKAGKKTAGKARQFMGYIRGIKA